jgi:hypothetical protein
MRIFRLSLVSFATTLLAGQAFAQSIPPQTPDTRRGTGDTSIFAPLTLYPAPTSYRTASGAPGYKYWQNDASYDLHASLDTTQRSVRGSMTLRYTNHSPDTLQYIWILTEQNIYREQSLSISSFRLPTPRACLAFRAATSLKNSRKS